MSPTTRKLPGLLVIASRRARFLDTLLARDDVQLALVTLGSERTAVSVSRLPEGISTFALDETSPLEQEVRRFTRWASEHDFQAAYFCNPNEAAQPLAQRFAAALGLPHLSPGQVDLVHEKPAMKEMFARVGLDAAKYALVKSRSDVLNFAKDHGWPLILKPTDSDTCLDTYKLRSPADDNLANADRSDRTWMIEAFVQGAEYQLCALVHEGRVLDAYLSRNPAPIIDVLEGAMNANITLAPSEFNPVDPRELAQLLADGVCLDSGYLHGEFFLTAGGQLVMGELAARLSGCEVPMNHGLAYGFDIMNAICDLYVGKRPALKYTCDRSVGDLLLPIRPGVISALSTCEELLELPGVVSCSITVEVGQEVDPPRMSSSSSGFVHVEGISSDQVRLRMSEVLDNFVFEVEA